MKKNLFYLFALICSMSLFTACSDDDEEPSPWIGSYGLADYSATDFNWTGNEVLKNFPSASALYVDWQYTGDDDYPAFLSGLIRYLGGSILPQVLNSVTLDKDGDIIADYVAGPEIAMDPSSIMSIFFTGEFPSASEVKAGFATGGFMTSPKGLASWSERNGKLTLKLHISAIMEAAGAGSDLGGLIEEVLNRDAQTVKTLLSAALGVDLSGITDATINQLLGWVKNGVPMNITTADNGHTYIYLDKTAFDNLFTLRDTGELSETGSPVMVNDLILLWNALVAGGIIPAEAQAAGMFISMIGGYWSVTTGLNIGLEVVRK